MDPSQPEVGFKETLNRTDRLRIGAAVGILLVVVFGVAVTMAASPAPAADPGSSASPGSKAPGSGGPRGFPFGPQGFAFGRGGFGPGGFPRGGGGVVGPITVTAVDGSSVSLKTADGWTRTITLSDSTKISKGGAAITASDLAVGDTVRLDQTRKDDGTYTVAAIVVELPRVAGTVTARDADSITIKGFDGTVSTIHVGAKTSYRVAGKTDAALADVAIGAVVVAEGTKRTDGSLDALTVGSGPARGTFPGPGQGKPFGPRDGGPKASPGASTTPG
jgi:Domain of unknown function (DUF5666)